MFLGPVFIISLNFYGTNRNFDSSSHFYIVTAAVTMWSEAGVTRRPPLFSNLNLSVVRTGPPAPPVMVCSFLQQLVFERLPVFQTVA